MSLPHVAFQHWWVAWWLWGWREQAWRGRTWPWTNAEFYWKPMLAYKTVKSFYIHSAGEHDEQNTLNLEFVLFHVNVRFPVNSCQLKIYFWKSDLHVGTKSTISFVFVHLSKICKISTCCCFIMFLSYLMLYCHCCFPVFVTFSPQSLQKWTQVSLHISDRALYEFFTAV